MLWLPFQLANWEKIALDEWIICFCFSTSQAEKKSWKTGEANWWFHLMNSILEWASYAVRSRRTQISRYARSSSRPTRSATPVWWEQENIRKQEGHIVEKNFITFTYVLINRKPSEHLVKGNRKTYKNWNTWYIVFDKYNCLFNNKKQIMFFWLSQVSPNFILASIFSYCLFIRIGWNE